MSELYAWTPLSGLMRGWNLADVYKEFQVKMAQRDVIEMCRKAVNEWKRQAEVDVYYSELLASNDELVQAIIKLGEAEAQ